MKYFYSYYPTPTSSDDDIFFTIISIKLSSTLLKKMNKKIGIYSDSKFIELLKKYEVELDFYENIEDEIKNISSEKLFAVCKLYSNIIQSEPFIQIDIDMFLFDNLDFNLLEEMPVSFYFLEKIDGNSSIIYYKNWKNTYLDLYNILEKKFSDLVYSEHTNPLIAYNCAIVGGKNWKTFHQIYQPIFDTIKHNKKYLETISKNPMSLLEQHIITGHLNKLGYDLRNINFLSHSRLPNVDRVNDELFFNINENENIKLPNSDEYFTDIVKQKIYNLRYHTFNGYMHLEGSKGLFLIRNLVYEMLKHHNSSYVHWLEKKFGKPYDFQHNKLNQLI